MDPLHVVPVSMLRSAGNCLKAIPSTQPFQAVVALAPEAKRLLRRMLAEPAAGEFDLVHVEHLRAASLGLDVAGTIPTVFDAVDCISRLLSEAKRLAPTRAGRLAASLDLRRTERFEAGLAARHERVLVASEADRQALIELAESEPRADPRRIAMLANGVDGAYFQPGTSVRDPSTLVYVGRMGYHSNVRAVLWLIEQVMPLIWAQRPDVRLEVVGEAPVRAIRRQAARHPSRVTVTGTVPDVRPHLCRATISVNSLVYGVGIQNKVLEAMATATPVVTTPVGCRALQARDGEHYLVAADPEEFAAQVVRLLENPPLRERMGAAGRTYVECHHSWPVVACRLERVYREVLDGRQSLVSS